jgi:hypothetical protein
MRPFSVRMFPHSVYLLAEADGSDPTASVVEGFPPTSGLAPIPCRVRLSATAQAPFGAGDGEVTATGAQIAFPAQPGAKKGDRFLRPKDGLTLRVLAPARARDGDGALFVVSCEVID